jgi:hypothetical protein
MKKPSFESTPKFQHFRDGHPLGKNPEHAVMAVEYEDPVQLFNELNARPRRDSRAGM